MTMEQLEELKKQQRALESNGNGNNNNNKAKGKNMVMISVLYFMR